MQTGVQGIYMPLKILDSDFRRNEVREHIQTFYETIKTVSIPGGFHGHWQKIVREILDFEPVPAGVQRLMAKPNQLAEILYLLQVPDHFY
jgi:hypothetical protein